MTPEHDVVKHRQITEQAQVLKCSAHAQRANLMGLQPHHIAPCKFNHTRIWRHDAREHVDHGGLARAVGADQGMHMASLQTERHILRCFDTPIGLANALHLQQGPWSTPRKLKVAGHGRCLR